MENWQEIKLLFYVGGPTILFMYNVLFYGRIEIMLFYNDGPAITIYLD